MIPHYSILKCRSRQASPARKPQPTSDDGRRGDPILQRRHARSHAAAPLEPTSPHTASASSQVGVMIGIMRGHRCRPVEKTVSAVMSAYFLTLQLVNLSNYHQDTNKIIIYIIQIWAIFWMMNLSAMHLSSMK